MSTSTTEDMDWKYILERNISSSSRLNLQHYLWKQICGFNLHPQILSSSAQQVKIADVATGTGVWIADAKQDHPNFKIDGFDISLAQCPPAELRPEGCSIRELDIRKNLPKDLESVYDIIHIKLFLGAIKNDPVPTLRNLIAMLRPGGYLQWQEINLSTISVSVKSPGASASVLLQILDKIKAMAFGKWTSHLSSICAEQGLLDTHTDHYPVPSSIRFFWCQTQLAAYKEISRAQMDNSSPDAEGPRFRELIQQGYQALAEGAVWDYVLEVTVAKKPG